MCKYCTTRGTSYPVSDEFEDPVQLSDLNCTGFTKLNIPTFDPRSVALACTTKINVKTEANNDTKQSFFCVTILSQHKSLPSSERERILSATKRKPAFGPETEWIC